MTQPAPNAFTALPSVRWTRHEHARITRSTARATGSIVIHPPVGTLDERQAHRALFESQADALQKFRRALAKR